MHHLISGINSLTHFVSHVLICLFLTYHCSILVSPQQCHHQYSSSLLTSITRSCFSVSKRFSFLNDPTSHRHLSPLRTSAGVRELKAPKYKYDAPIIGSLKTEPPAGSRSRVLNQGSRGRSPSP